MRRRKVCGRPTIPVLTELLARGTTMTDGESVANAHTKLDAVEASRPLNG
jgi:hypothetical protein